jgi:hypothetical protein
MDYWTADRLNSLLKASQHWGVPSGVDFAVDQLLRRPNVDSALALHIATSNGVDAIRLEEHIIALIVGKLHEIPWTSLSLLAPNFIVELLVLRGEFKNHQACSFIPTPFGQDGCCPNPVKCRDTWYRLWVRHIASISQEGTFTPFRVFIKKLSSAVLTSVMASHCECASENMSRLRAQVISEMESADMASSIQSLTCILNKRRFG